MAKFYRVIKDHPIWEVGAILSNEDDSDSYKPISDLWVKDIKSIDDSWYEGASLVEHQPEWFERVYKVSILKQTKYLTKDLAKQAHENLYRGNE